MPPDPDDEDPPDDDDDEVALAFASSAPTLSLQISSVRRRAAQASFSSNECVATRFQLRGADGSTQQGSSAGFDPATECANTWNLVFSGADRLEPATAYVLRVWVKGAESGKTASSELSFTTRD